MIVLHRADLVLPVAAPPLADGAVAVRDGRIAAVGPYRELAAAHPAARVRAWGGVLTPGLRTPYGRPLLEHAYHPDPREAEELGTEPLTGPALAALAMDDTRWGASARRGLQRMLAHGTTALSGPFERAPVRTAVARSGLAVLPPPATDPGEPGFDLLRAGLGTGLEAAVHGPLALGARADLAVFAVDPDGDPEAALRRRGAGGCIATVLAGRLVHRRR
ncbi:amidohydrolase family protein [Peterkaempfera bronchialis]|uniref:amidohydrolase family protein n=1 Tax=Peterkaempfera bronchialis TaxID=2126346 RepID=UPI003C2F8F90